MLVGLGKRRDRAGQSQEVEQFWIKSTTPVPAGQWADAVFPIKSAEGVDTIKQVADNIFAKSNECVSMVRDVQTLLGKERDDISATCSSFATLSKTISDNIVAVSRISEKSKQLDGIKQSIIANITDLSAISEENAASNEEVSANVTSIAEAIDQMNTATGHVSKVSDELAEMMKYFE